MVVYIHFTRSLRLLRPHSCAYGRQSKKCQDPYDSKFDGYQHLNFNFLFFQNLKGHLGIGLNISMKFFSNCIDFIFSLASEKSKIIHDSNKLEPLLNSFYCVFCRSSNDAGYNIVLLTGI